MTRADDRSAPVRTTDEVPRPVLGVMGHDLDALRHFTDPSHEWRRIIAELVGTFFLVVVAAGAPTVDGYVPGTIGRAAAVTAPGLMVMAIILFMGAVSGAHLNPAVTVAFSLRREFPWRRVPAYFAAQLLGATLACLLLWALFGKVGQLGATEPQHGVGLLAATTVEVLLTFGLVSTILGTASGAQNVGPMSAIAVGGYIALAGLWSSPVTGASMNPARSFGPDLVLWNFDNYWVYLIGPLVGALLAAVLARLLRGPGGDVTAIRAAQGTLGEPVLPVDRRHG
ncbi:MAG TPA: aquaporin [Jatrophihabitans sp.]|nr:aquaporin [Jatrophihabitans sp.]